MKAGYLSSLAISSVVGITVVAQQLPHWDLEMTSADYERALIGRDRTADPALKEILDHGKRLLDWLRVINSHRPPERQISLTGPQFQTGIPIETPRRLNPPLVVSRLATLKQEIPASLGKILFEGAPFTNDPPMPDDEFAAWGRRLNAIYESASRWILLEPYKEGLAASKRSDVRGYYYLAQVPQIEKKLLTLASLPTQESLQITEWLLILCMNSDSSEEMCRSQLKSSSAAGKALEFYHHYLSAGEKNWNRFFLIGFWRNDIKWTDISTMHVPFRSSDTNIETFLKSNIEDEWRWQSWGAFVSNCVDMTQLG